MAQSTVHSEPGPVGLLPISRSRKIGVPRVAQQGQKAGGPLAAAAHYHGGVTVLAIARLAACLLPQRRSAASPSRGEPREPASLRAAKSAMRKSEKK